jgi:hypothetical protein
MLIKAAKFVGAIALATITARLVWKLMPTGVKKAVE